MDMNYRGVFGRTAVLVSSAEPSAGVKELNMGGAWSGISRLFYCFVASIVLHLAPHPRPAAAQTGATASIVGQVTDESNAVLPGVTVTATSPALQVPSVTDVTSATGEYRLTTLPIGTY